MDSFTGAESLRQSLGNGDVKLLKASWLLEHMELLQINQQQLEEVHPEAFVQDEMAQGLLNEAEGVSAVCEPRDLHKCMYPGLVLISHCWHQREHAENRSESVQKALHTQLRWYAAQRAKYTRTRLYGPTKTTSLALASQQQFNWDFGVVLDSWALLSSSAPSQASSARWQSVWYAHAGTTKFLLRENGRAPEELAKGSVGRGIGICCLQERLALLAGPRHCLDMGGFEEMLSTCTPATSEQLPAAEIRAELGKSRSRFEREDLAVEDKEGLQFSKGSCLRPLRVKRPQAPLLPREMEEQLRAGGLGLCEEELGLWVAGYSEAATAWMGQEEELQLEGTEHWDEADFARLGRCMALYTRVRGVRFAGGTMPGADEGLAAFVGAVEAGGAKTLRYLALSGVGSKGMAALAQAVGGGTMVGLRTVYGVPGLDEAEVQETWRRAGRVAQVEGASLQLAPRRRLSSCCSVS